MYKVLVLVPHPDDEINVAGNLFKWFKDAKAHVTVAIVTNGDYISALTKKRQEEALNAKRILGYENLVYLGYGDGYKGVHLYHNEGNTVVESVAGFSSTYNVSNECPAFHYTKYNEQTAYTRNHLKSDLKDLILDVAADLIVCVDNDKHPEHRCLSLIFDEVMGEFIKVQNYRPYVLKAFAYIGVYDSVRDFFTCPAVQTLPAYQGTLADEGCVFPYLWEERKCIKTPRENINSSFWKSPIFKALLAHHSQRAACRFDQIMNADSVYFQRRTDSLTYNCKVEVSSGDKSYLNDFKIVDYDNICDNRWEENGSLEHSWYPKADDIHPFVEYTFKNVQSLNEVVIYQNKTSKLSAIHVVSDLGYDKLVEVNNSYKLSIMFDEGTEATKLKLYFIGENIQINEIEIYENKVEDILEKFRLPKSLGGNDISVGNKYLLYKCMYFIFKLIYMDKKLFFKRIKFKLLHKNG